MTVSLDVVNFKKEMERVKREVQAQADLEIKGRIEYATETLKIVTPVDTGKARSGWKNEIYKNSYLAGKIFNDVEYIDVLNRGHSKQAPRYFIEQVLITIGVLTPN